MLHYFTIDNASGTGDFESFSQTIVFQASSGYFQASVVVEIADDDVNEAEEAFVILLVPDLNRSNSSDLLDLQLTNGTALGVIEDNDGMCILHLQLTLKLILEVSQS